MARRLAAALLAALVLCASTAIAYGRSQDGITWSTLSASEFQSPVEQQSDYPWMPGPIDCSANQRCVVNPTSGLARCSWDVDDHWGDIGLGSLAPGASATHASCQILDANPQYQCLNGLCTYWSSTRGRMDVKVSAPSADLVVTVTWPALGRTFTLPATATSNRDYQYLFCGQAVFASDDPALGPIAGSNGSSVDGSTEGTGIRSNVVVTLSNPTGHKVQSIGTAVQLVGVGASGNACPQGGDPGNNWFPMRAYPFNWTWGG